MEPCLMSKATRLCRVFGNLRPFREYIREDPREPGGGRRPNCGEPGGSATFSEQVVRDRMWDVHFQQIPACRPPSDDANNLHRVLLEVPAT